MDIFFEQFRNYKLHFLFTSLWIFFLPENFSGGLDWELGLPLQLQRKTEVIEPISKYDIRALCAIFEAHSNGWPRECNISNRSKKLYIHMDFACSAKNLPGLNTSYCIIRRPTVPRSITTPLPPLLKKLQTYRGPRRRNVIPFLFCNHPGTSFERGCFDASISL